MTDLRAGALALALSLLGGLALHAEPAVAGPCDPPFNEIVCENSKAGTPASVWDVEGAGASGIQGYSTDISVDQGGTIEFKVDTGSDDYRLDIYRMGYYGGDGARKVASVEPSASLPQSQPPCDLEPSTGLVDCGKWGVSASWAVPGDAVSGIYFAKLEREDVSSEGSHIVFVVRDDDGESNLLFQTSDTTWQAYNEYGSNSLYTGGPGESPGRAYKVSYNRPLTVRQTNSEDSPFNAEYPMVRWLERNGYDVSYSSGVDTDRAGAELLEHEAFLSVGHDEYWSAAQRANVEAARDAGVHIAFFSGNEIFWKTRWEESIDGSEDEYRTLVCYKETHADEQIDPEGPETWTGTWRDPRFSPPGDGGRPENELSGTAFMVNAGTAEIEVPAADGAMRLWRDTDIAELEAGETATLGDSTLGYEWDEDLDNGFRPPGLIRLSSTTEEVPQKLLDHGDTYGPGTATHHLTLYRAASEALVFSAGTIQWAWGLDSEHDRGEAPPDARMQQATVNLLADMGIQPETLQGGLVAATETGDHLPPNTTIAAPADEGEVELDEATTISGTASDAEGESDPGGEVGGVEVSVDGGETWHPAEGRENWTYTWFPDELGEATILARAADDSGNLEDAPDEVAVEVVPLTCPCSIWNDTFTGPQDSDTNAVELGVKLRSETAGYITGLRFYKTVGNTGTHSGRLWNAAGEQLATVTFSGETATGWQQATFDTPVSIAADTTYVASYHAPNGRYAAVKSYFALSGFENPPLYALADDEDGPNGIYKYGSPGALFAGGAPDSFQSENYLVDVVFELNVGPDTTPPKVKSRSPVDGSDQIGVDTPVRAVFDEPIDPATVSGATFQLRDSEGTPVAAAVSYDSELRQATLDPSASLLEATAYTATLKGGSEGVKDVAGNPLEADEEWSFTTIPPPPPPPDAGPGGPILVISHASNPFSRYYGQILEAEGLNEYTVAELSTITPAALEARDVAILGEGPLSAAQATMLSEWVQDGGNLIAMRPDADLLGLLGLSAPAGSLAEGYVEVDTAPGTPGAGIVGETIQFHGTADRYTAAGAQTIATLFSDATTSTGDVAVTLRSVGSNGGHAAAFAYDLARSVVYTRQGNPAWDGDERDGLGARRSDDLFFGAKAGDVQPDWIDFSKVHIPQADEQQRLLTNLIGEINLDRKPLPRFWFLPRDEKAAVVMTGDDHANNGTTGRFEEQKALDPPGCSVADWECVRSTSYIYPNTPITDAKAAQFATEGFELGLHVTTGCNDWDNEEELGEYYGEQLTEFSAKFPSLPPPRSSRTHCIVWSDWASQPKVELARGIRLDTNYYYWPDTWVQDRPGMFTGSGMPMRFAEKDGSLIDVYQATTQMTDESEQTYPFTSDALLDRALGPEGYYGVFTANMHTDKATLPESTAIMESALARDVPIVSARQMLTWLDGRNQSSFGSIEWANDRLSFTIDRAEGANGLRAMVPVSSAIGPLGAVELGETPVATTTETIKGVEYAFFDAEPGEYTANYLDESLPEISNVEVSAGNDGTATIVWETDEPADSRVDYGTNSASLELSATDPALVTSHSIELTGLDPDSVYHFRVSSADAESNTATEPELLLEPQSFATPPAAPLLSATVPPSPANENAPDLVGSASAGSSVDIYATVDCSGAPLAGGTAAELEAGIEVAVADDASTELRATATSGAGTSPCSAPLAYLEDSIAPETQLTGAPPALSNSATATFAFTGEDPAGSGVAGLECRLDSEDPEGWDECISPREYAELGEGAHKFEVRAIDNAGNADQSPAVHEWTVDTVAPALSIDSGPEGLTTDSTPAFAFSPEPGAAVSCSIDQGTPGFGPCSDAGSHTPAAPLADASYTLRVRAVDAAGNESLRTRSFEVDATAPTTQIDSGPAPLAVSATATFAFSGDDAGGSGVASFECKLDEGSFEACSSGIELTELSEGAHSFEVRAIDNAGNLDATPAKHEWTVDSLAPETQITAQPPAFDNSATANFSFAGSDPGGSGVGAFQCRRDSEDPEDWQPCLSPLKYTSLAEGPHVFEVRVIDNAGNVDQSPATYEWTIDTVAPETQITAGPDPLVNSATANFSFAGSDPGGSGVASFQCRRDSTEAAAWTACTSPHAYTELADGPHEVEVRAVDQAGNADPSPAAHSWTIDTTPPALSIESGPEGLTADDAPTFTFAYTPAPGDTLECSIDSGEAAFGPCTTDGSHSAAGPLANGTYTFRVRATDEAGNPAVATRDFEVDATLPETEITLEPAALMSSDEASFEFAASDPEGAGVAGFECKLDGAAFTVCTSPRAYAGLSEGSHKFEVRAIDVAGNLDPTPAAYEWVVDTVAPDTQIDLKPAALANSSEAKFEFSGDDGAGSGIASFQCRRDSTEPAAWAPCTSPHVYTELAQGAHEFEVRAIDNAGNTDQSAATHGWEIDSIAPETQIDLAPPALTNSANATFEFSGDDPGGSGVASFQCRRDSTEPVGWQLCSSPRVYTSLAEGTHTFEVRAIDVAGSPDPTPASFEWEIDTKAPQTEITAKPATLVNSATAKFEFEGEDVLEGSGVASFQCRRDSTEPAAWAPCTSGVEYTELGEGSHKFEVRAIDSAGNLDASPASHEWTIDLTPPGVQIDAGPEGLTGDATPTFAFSSEPGATFQCSIDTGTPAFAACSGAGSHTPAAPLPDGAKTFRVRATDAAGNQAVATRAFDVDATAPDTQIDLGPTALTNSTTAQFEFSGHDGTGSGVASFECKLDAGSFVACSSGVEPDELSEGSHSFEVRAIDSAGNADGTPAKHEWTVDLTPPAVSVDSGPEGPTNDASPTFEFSSEPGATFQCSIDQGTPAFGPCSDAGSHTPAEPLPNGPHTFRVRATDGAGNQAVATREFEVNTAVPEAPQLESTLPASPANHNTPKVIGTAQAGTTVTIYESADCTGTPLATVSVAELEAGAEVNVADNSTTALRATATAPPENTSPCSEPLSYVEDSSAPDTQIDAKPALLVNSAKAKFEFSGDDAGGSGVASFQCRVDSTEPAAWAPCISGIEYAELSEGSHKFEVRAIDQAGNIDATPASHEWTVDLTAPAVSVDAGPSGLTSDNTPTFAFSSEPAASFECSIDDGTPDFGPCSDAGSHTPATPVSDGARTFRVRATDAAGNQATATRGFTIDATPPDTQIDLVPALLASDDVAKFEFSGNDGTGSGIAAFECRRDSTEASAWAPCSSGIEYAELSEGAHKFEVRAIDNAGNTDQSAASYEWTVDTAAPETQITAQPAVFASNAIASFEFSGDDGAGSGVAGFECKLDEAPFAACASGVEYTALSEGAHSFEVRAIDNAGNADGTPAKHEWTVDATAPDTTIDTAPAALVNSDEATFEFSGEDGSGSGIASFECKLDEAAFASCTSGIELTGLSEGAHSFEVRAIDSAGNADSTPAKHEWTIDLTPPVPAIDSLSKALLKAGETSEIGWHADQNGEFELRVGGADCETGTAIDSGPYTGAPNPATSNVTAAQLAEGDNTLRLCLGDAAGNRGTATSQIAKDTLAPDTQIDSAPAALVNIATATFAFSGEDTGGSGIASFQCKLDDDAFELCSSDVELSGLAEGSHEFEVRAIDNAGNVDASAAKHEWSVDLTAPVVSVDFGPEGLTNDPTPTFEFSSEPGASFQCSIDDGTPDFGPCSAAASHTPEAPLADGSHTFRVRATDQAGNQATATRDFTVDTAAPEAPQLQATVPPSPANHNTPLVEGSAPAGTTVDLYTGADCNGAPIATVTPAELEAGVGATVADDSTTAFRATATTAAENTSGCSEALTYVEDSTDPGTSIDDAPAALVNAATAAFEFSGSDPDGSGIASFECKLDDGAFASCSSGIELTGLAEGAHSFEVRAIDHAGNMDASAAIHEWTVDLTPPAVSVDSGPEGLTNDASPSFAFSSEPGATFECSIDSGTPDFGPCSDAGSHTPEDPLADGAHTFRVRATDQAGNQATATRDFNLDATAPSTQIDEAPAPLVSSDEASFEFSGDDGSGSGIASFECRRDSEDPGAWTPCGSPRLFTELSEGAHEFEVRAIDNAGNTDQSAAVHIWTVDTVAPDTQIDDAPAALVNSATATFEFSGDDAGGSGIAGFECKLDDGSFTACNPGIELTELAEGSHEFEVRAIDNAGNVDGSAASHEWTVDTVAPATQIDTAPATLVNSDEATFEFSGSDPEGSGIASFQCKLDDGPFEACSSGIELTELAEGAHSFEVRAIDNAGNTDGSAAKHEWAVDLTPPSVSIDSGPEGLTNDPTPTFEFSSEPGATLECSIDDGTPDFAPCSDAASHTPEAPLPDGPHTFRVRATDEAGNQATATRDFTVDTAAPAAPELQATVPPSPANDNTPLIQGSAPAGTTVKLYTGADCNGAPIATVTPAELEAGVEATVADDSTTSFRATATTAAENTSGCSAPLTYVEDSTDPGTTIDDGPAALVSSAAATFEFSGDDSGGSGIASFECKLDDGAFAACAPGIELSGLSEGAHSFEVRAIDNAGNVDASPAKHEWTVDTVAPTTQIDLGPAAISASVNAKFEFSGADGGSGLASFQCRRDSDEPGDWTPCASPTNYPGLADGQHSFEVRAIDVAGNIDASPAIFEWEIDSKTPDTQIGAKPAVLVGSDEATFEFSATDPEPSSGIAGFECRLDSADPEAWEGCASGIELTELSEGAHKFEVRAIDNAGNRDGTPASHEWSVDTVAPSTQIDSGPAALVATAAASFSFSGADPGGSGIASFECKLDDGGFAACASPREYSALADGPHSFEVRAIDNAGNVDQSAALHEWEVDTTPPALSIDSGPDGLTNNATPTFAFSSEPGASFQCSIDQGTPDFGPCSDAASHTPESPLPDGPHTFRVRATDEAGNQATATRDFEVDTGTPAVPVLTETDPPSPANDNTPLVEGNAPAGTTVELFAGADCSGAPLASGSAAELTAGIEVTVADDSTTAFRATATTAAENTSGCSEALTYVEDSTDPGTSIDDAPAALVNAATAAFEFSGSDPDGSGIASFECKLDDGSFAACNSGIELTGLAEGAHSFEVRAIDHAGNVDGSAAIHEWSVDTVAPTTQIDSGPATISASASAKFEFSGADGGSGLASFECRRDAEDWSPCTSPRSYSALAEGSHSFEVRAIDVAGNVDQSAADFGWEIDTKAPDTAIDSGPATLVSGASAEFEFSASDAAPSSGIASFECKLDDGAFEACSSGIELSGLSEGSHEFEVRAIDHAGNVDGSAARHTWSVDLTAPVVSVDSGPEGLTNDPTPTFEFSSEPGASFQCSIDDGTPDFAPCSNAASHTPDAPLADGPRTFRVRATDEAGNQAVATRDFEVDTTPPGASIDSGPEGLTNDPTPTFEFSSEPGASFQCSIDDGTPDFAPCSDAASHTPEDPLADGEHTFRVRATDEAGNQATAARDFEVNTAIPAAPTLDATAPVSPANENAPRVSGTAQAGTAVRIYETPDCSGAALAVGGAAELESGGIEIAVADDSTIELRATATAPPDNVSACSAALTYVEDSTAPATQIDSGPGSISSSSTAKFTFSGSDPGGVGVPLFQCRLDSSSEEAWEVCESPKTFSSLADGPHKFEVRAIDAAGNVDLNLNDWIWAVDTSEPSGDDSSSTSSTPSAPAPAPAPTPPAPAQFVRIAYNTKAGTAQLFFTVPGPGLLTARAPEFKLPDAKSSNNRRRAALRRLRIRQRSIMPRTIRVAHAGQVRVPIALSRVGRKLLRRSGKLKVRVVIGYRLATGASAKVWRLPVTLKKREGRAAKRAQRRKQRRAKRAQRAKQSRGS